VQVECSWKGKGTGGGDAVRAGGGRAARVGGGGVRNT
jgi:hypothetical protein